MTVAETETEARRFISSSPIDNHSDSDNGLLVSSSTAHLTDQPMQLRAA
jgi:hypothetical protein